MYVLYAEFYIGKKLSEMPNQIQNNEPCNCNKPKIIEKMTDFNPLIIKNKSIKKRTVNWNDYFTKAKNIFKTKDITTSYT